VLDKLTPNQRLIVAVVLSIVFFVAYTAIFPQKEPLKSQDINNTQVINSKTSSDYKSVSNVVGHEVSNDEKVASKASNNIVSIKSKNFIMKLDTLGRVSSKILLQDKFNNSDNIHAQLISPNGTKPLYIRFADDKLNKEASTVPYTSNLSNIELDNKPVKLILTQKLPDLTVKKELTIYADGHYDVNIQMSKDKRYYVYLGQRPHVSKKLMAVAGAMIYTNKNKSTIVEDGKAEGRQVFNDVALASAFDQYTTTMLYGLHKDTNVIIQQGKDDNPVIYIEANGNSKFNGYLGPKEYKVLKAINPILTNCIEYGWFTFAAKPLFAILSWLHGIFGNWGWAIIALTALIRVVLYPLTYKGMVSMQKMKLLAPKLKELKTKHKKDPQRLNAATMEMYKKHGANPLGGCLPMLLQIPVFFALYRTLLNSVELQGAPWMLWIHDLSRMDPYYVLPILMGASMFMQQRMTPNNFTDPMQEKVFKYLPVVFTFFFVTFPSGLVLYWFTNNLFSIAQQYMVNKQFTNTSVPEVVVEKSTEK